MTMDDSFCKRFCCTASRIKRIAENAFELNNFKRSESSVNLSICVSTTPAQHTIPFTLGKADTSCCTLSFVERSAAMKECPSPSSESSVCCRRSWLRAVRIQVAPAAAHCCVTALPIPDDAPVTRIIFPVSEKMSCITS